MTILQVNLFRWVPGTHTGTHIAHPMQIIKNIFICRSASGKQTGITTHCLIGRLYLKLYYYSKTIIQHVNKYESRLNCYLMTLVVLTGWPCSKWYCNMIDVCPSDRLRADVEVLQLHIINRQMVHLRRPMITSSGRGDMI